MPHAGPKPRTLVRVVSAMLALILGIGTLAVATPAQAAYAKPSGLAVESTATTSLRLKWKPVSKAPAYRIKYDDNSAMKSPAYAGSTTAGVELTNLKAGKYYWVKVRVISSKSASLSGYGATIKVKTRSATDFALLSPAALVASGVSDSSLTLAWATRGETDNYRVRWATNSKLTDVGYVRVTAPRTTLADLSPGITYYLSVRVIDPTGANLSQYSPMITVKTTGKASFSPPIGVAASKTTSGGFTLSWKPLAGALKYRVKYATDPWTDPEYVAADGPSIVLTELSPKTTYYLKVRVLNSDGSFASDYSATVEVTTPAASAPLRVASYNVRCHNCDSGSANEEPWTKRRAGVVSTIDSADPDVVALQEAQQSWLVDSSGKKVDLSQFEDLVNRLGNPWALTNKYRNNCVKSTTPTNCVYADRGASNGTKIIYRTDRLTLIDQGSKELSSLYKGSYDRFVVWAIFRQIETGREFFFADIHLEPDNDTGTSLAHYTIRKTQANDVLAAIKARNPDHLPVIVAGDPASNKFDVPTNAPYDVFTAGGLVDPLGNTWRSTMPVKPTVEKRINTNYNSFNAWDRFARRSTNVNGTYTDYIFTSPMRVSEWETVVKVDANNDFVGVIPSDHNLIRATVWLP
jgi:endonuclease/exonuclease/phosphatase family metal-dependent hydrolase